LWEHLHDRVPQENAGPPMSSTNLFAPGDIFNTIYLIEEPFDERDGPIRYYLARDTQNNRLVRLHCLDRRPADDTPEQRERFHAMVARLRALNDSHLASLYDGGVTARIYWVATEFAIEGQTLASILGTPERRFSITECLLAAGQLAGSLQKAHAAGIRHLRLHPDRILVHPREASVDKLLDIGLAELFSLPPAVLRAEPLYAAPEALRDSGKPADQRADIYGLGMLLYAMLSWAHPFAASDGRLPKRDVSLLLAMTQAPPLLGVGQHPFPEFLDVFVQSSIAKVRANRPASMAAFRDATDELYDRYRVWCDTLNHLGELEPAKAKRLFAELSGPAPEGASVGAAGVQASRGLEPRAKEPTKPRSGERPSAALRAGIEGYSPQDDELPGGGTAEPAWFAALPEEREPDIAETDAAVPLVSAEAPATPVSTNGPGAPAPTSGEASPPVLESEPPPNEPTIEVQEEASPEPVTLPSGHLPAPSPGFPSRRVGPKRYALAACALGIAGLSVLIFLGGSRIHTERPRVAWSARLHAALPRGVDATPNVVTPRAPDPDVSALPLNVDRGHVPPLPPARQASPVSPHASAPAASSARKGELCGSYACRPKRAKTQK